MGNTNKLANFLFELGTLKHVKRSGWWLINVKDPENVAEHSFRAGVIGYFLARLEKADVNKVTMMCLFNDLHEARINDLHKVGQRYIDFRVAETEVQKEQAAELGEAGKEMFSLHQEFQEQKTKEAIVARDADLLENAFQAKEYLEIGYRDAQNWIDNIKKVIKTEYAKKLLEEIEQTSSNDWWRNLKKIGR
ncbi:MAG: HD domain-containing protein [Nanoarchaeota archaeon]